MTGLVLVGLLLRPGNEPLRAADSSETGPLPAVVEIDPPGSDSYFEMVQSESDKLSLLDDLLWRQEHPYDLNTVTEAELESIPGVTPHEASELVLFRRQRRGFISVEQIKELDDSGDELYEKLSPFVTVKYQAPLVQVRSRASRDLQPRRGFMDSTFLGSSLKSYGRLLVESRDFQMGAVAEKDAGEQLANGFVSGYIAANNMGPLGRVVLGDFTVEAGQGLVFWRGSSFGKGSESVGVVKKSGVGIQPCRSTDEFNYFRGAAAGASFGTPGGRINVTALFSRRNLDGSVDSLHRVTSLYEAGLFQTQNDLARRNAVMEQVAGGRAELVGNGWQIGSTGYHASFDKRITSNRIYEFSGSTQDVLGLDAAVTAGRVSAFGEIAGSGNKGLAGIAGTILNIGPRSNLALVYRDYGAAFSNLHASGFGEHSNVKNERGLYAGADIRVLTWLRVSGYVDQFRFPWRTYFDPLPTTGHEILLQADATVSSKLEVSTRFSHKSTEGAEADLDPYGRDIRTIMGRGQEKYRLNATYEASPRWSVKGRVEFTEVGYGESGGKEKGFLLYQDLRYRVSGRFTVEGRLIFFQTDSYDSRVYEYESDIRGVFSNPGLYGKGKRWYVVLHYTVANKLTLSSKYSEMQKEGVTSIGSGSDEIPGDVSDRLAFQIDVRL